MPDNKLRTLDKKDFIRDVKIVFYLSENSFGRYRFPEEVIRFQLVSEFVSNFYPIFRCEFSKRFLKLPSGRPVNFLVKVLSKLHSRCGEYHGEEHCILRRTTIYCFFRSLSNIFLEILLEAFGRIVIGGIYINKVTFWGKKVFFWEMKFQRFSCFSWKLCATFPYFLPNGFGMVMIVQLTYTKDLFEKIKFLLKKNQY